MHPKEQSRVNILPHIAFTICVSITQGPATLICHVKVHFHFGNVLVDLRLNVHTAGGVFPSPPATRLCINHVNTFREQPEEWSAVFVALRRKQTHPQAFIQYSGSKIEDSYSEVTIAIWIQSVSRSHGHRSLPDPVHIQTRWCIST